MIEREVVVQNQQGLHARPAITFVLAANEYGSSIWVKRDTHKVRAKSLLEILSLNIVSGNKIGIIADGKDEESAASRLVELVKSGFEEA